MGELTSQALGIIHESGAAITAFRANKELKEQKAYREKENERLHSERQAVEENQAISRYNQIIKHITKNPEQRDLFVKMMKGMGGRWEGWAQDIEKMDFNKPSQEPAGGSQSPSEDPHVQDMAQRSDALTEASTGAQSAANQYEASDSVNESQNNAMQFVWSEIQNAMQTRNMSYEEEARTKQHKGMEDDDA